jgi:N-acetylglucosaminyl-diphospho-decaprenol L-rhamnosyltransferase
MTTWSAAVEPRLSPPTIDICVVTYRSEETIGDLISSVKRHLPGARILVCDNSPDQATVWAVRAAGTSGTDCIVFQPGRNLGFGRGCNELARRSDAEWLIFVNPDADIVQFSLDLADLPARTVVGAIVRGIDGEVQDTFGPERTMASEIAIRLFRRKPRVATQAEPFEVAFVSGAALAVRRSDFLALDGFNVDRYFMYYEDIDFCRRVREAGGQVTVGPGWCVRHIGGHSAKKAHATALIRSYISAANYHRQWSRTWWLFRPVCVLEASMKAMLSILSGRVGHTSRSTQWRHLAFLLGWRRP